MDKGYDFGVPTIGALLSAASQEFTSQLHKAFLDHGHRELAEQLDKVVIPRQTLQGSAMDFSFMAYPLPRLTFEERQTATLVAAAKIHVELSECSATVAVDEFGQINWFYVFGAPEIYSAIGTELEKVNEGHGAS